MEVARAKVLDRGLLVEEIKVAISRMANDKALGLDRLPIEFYKKEYRLDSSLFIKCL